MRAVVVGVLMMELQVLAVLAAEQTAQIQQEQQAQELQIEVVAVAELAITGYLDQVVLVLLSYPYLQHNTQEPLLEAQ
jgi:hypothetical protein